jgi:hypothetical protein
VSEAASREVAQTIGGEKIRDYEAFSLIRVPDARRGSVAAAATARGLRAIEHEEWDRVLLPGGVSVDTRAPQAPASGVIASYPQGRGLYVVQFDGPLNDADSDKLATFGLRYLGYVPHNAALVVGTQKQVDLLAKEPGVQWTSIYHTAFRAQPKFVQQPESDDEYIVQVANVDGKDALVDFVRRSSRRKVDVTDVGPYLNVYAQFSAATAQQFIAEPLVVAIEKKEQTLLSGERESISVTNLNTQLYTNDPYQDGVQPFKFGTSDYRTWLSNRGVLDTSSYRIAFADSGLDGNDPTLRLNHPDIGRTNMVWQSYVAGEDASDTVGHGTLVTGLAVGDPAATQRADMTSQKDAGGFFLGMGTAPKTGIYVQKIITNAGALTTGTTQITWANDANYWGSVAQTHSHNEYGNAATAGTYTVSAQEYDTSVRDTYLGDSVDTPLSVTVSAGNIAQGSDTTSTMVLAPATGKNIISVGGVESYRPGAFSACNPASTGRRAEDFQADSFKNVAWRSRRGTVDGRIKPDILAPMNQISSTRTQFVNGAGQQTGFFCNNTGDGYYTYDSGTSFAAPQVAGAIALLDKKKNSILTPAMAKAALIGSALSVKGGIDRRTGGTVAARPNSVQGFGRLYLGEALSSSTVQSYFDESSWTPFTAAGQWRGRTLTVANSSKPVVIVLAWSDEPGNVNANPALVRDLDLEIWPNDGCGTYTGNQLTASETSRLQGVLNCGPLTYDRVNNVEMIVIPAGGPASIPVDIYSTTWGFGSHNQKFALYVSNAS